MNSSCYAITKDNFKALEAQLKAVQETLRKREEQVADKRRSDDIEWSESIQPDPEISALRQQIESMKTILETARILERPVCSSVIAIGAEVTLELSDGKKLTVQISTPIPGAEVRQISPLSPLGDALMGAKVDQTVTYTAPAGQMRAKIISVTY